MTLNSSHYSKDEVEKQMTLNKIFKERGIELYDDKGELRNPINIIEDMYLKLNSLGFTLLMRDIEEEEKYSNIFDKARGGKYNGN